jgi:hypothetical protein
MCSHVEVNLGGTESDFDFEEPFVTALSVVSNVLHGGSRAAIMNIGVWALHGPGQLVRLHLLLADTSHRTYH